MPYEVSVVLLLVDGIAGGWSLLVLGTFSDC